ncbi:MAG: hypothetical protein LBN00_08495 [Oscillospiraceae bacterium]|jgi:hypothetical protein|nr:hypothetical protein [Oscillospiraceae bacterium]
MKRIPKAKAWGGTSPKFDERQLQIRSTVLTRAWILTVALLFACAFVESALEVEWAQSWQTYLLVAVVSFTYGGIELLLRGAYFEKNGMVGWGLPYVLAVLALISTVWRVVDFVRGDKFIADGILTEEGGFFIISLLLLAFGTIGVVKSRELRNHWEEPDDGE